MSDKATIQKYEDMLTEYLSKPDEETLYKAEQLSRNLLEQQISPEEIISLHIEALQKIFPNLSEDIRHSFDFLLEVMMGYGLTYREHQSLRHEQLELQSEIAVAVSMQKTLLKTEFPTEKTLDIGAKSVPAKQMNGDYFHFVQDENDCVSIAVADVIGKGIPAALCMSMIKYSMDSVPEIRMQPSAVLESLNRVVEQNVDSSMFITMFYGIYDPRVHRFYYASAGHEPGFYYHADEDRFEELYAKGLVLGVSQTTAYEEYQRDVKKGDMIILLSDGVTECRYNGQIIDRNQIVKIIKKYQHFSAQQIVENVYKELEEIQGLTLRDDFTLIIIRRKV